METLKKAYSIAYLTIISNLKATLIIACVFALLIVDAISDSNAINSYSIDYNIACAERINK